MPQAIYGLGGGHTHTYFGDMKVISKNQARSAMPGLKIFHLIAQSIGTFSVTLCPSEKFSGQ